MPSAGEALAAPINTSINRDMLVANKRTIARGVVALTLTDPDGDRLPDWSAGGRRRDQGHLAIRRRPHSRGRRQHIAQDATESVRPQ
jgi:hypothetical protein